MAELDYNLIKKLFHMGERAPADFEHPVPDLKTVSQLADPAIYVQFEALVKKIIEQDDQEVALLGSRVLRDLLKQYPHFKQSAPELYEKYLKLVGLLRFMNLSVPGLPEISELVRSHLLSAMRFGVPIVKRFEEVFDIYDDILLGGAIAEGLGKAMLASDNRIGQQQVLIGKEKRSAPPIVGNWLIDYRSMIAADKGGSFERITYMNQSQNVQKLNPQEKELLTKVIKLYDWLRFGGPVEDEKEEVVGHVTHNTDHVTETKAKPPLTSPLLPSSHASPGIIPRPPVIPSGALPGHKLTSIEQLLKKEIPHQPARRSLDEGGVAFTEEIKREVATPELPAHEIKSTPKFDDRTKQELVPLPRPAPGGERGRELLPPKGEGSPNAPRPVTPLPPLSAKGGSASGGKPLISSSHDIKFLDDLKKIDAKYLRQGELPAQILNLKSKISNLAASNHMYIHEVIAAFQQSPLFKAYVAHGNSKVAGQPINSDMTQAEFEAMADLRKELERM